MAKKKSPEVSELTVSLDEFVNDGKDEKFRELLSVMYGFASRFQGIRKELARNLELSVTDFSVLMALYTAEDAEGLRVRLIADRLHIAAANVTASINNLEREGWIEKREDSTDSRALNISLSRKGRKALDSFTIKLRSVNDTWFAGITEDEFVHAENFMRRLIAQYQSAIYASKLVNWDKEMKP
ncbi:MarR family winged helix-turn-helix transcriptional regulator [Ruegeria arenilitoris]|uniref:MarR family winged helix-turn-helix transcriptional regulator n=1 Tax=Ruegeria arenilitoris TaxID=1173585 RepID=UPI001480CF82|nr:MarR family transcriptional regulator [Ruegeria arenilitoris]